MPAVTPAFKCSRDHLTCRLSGAVVAISMLGAGLLKLADLPEFSTNLNTWTLFKGTLFLPLIVVGVPLVEVTLGLSWLLNLGRRRVMIAAGFLLLAFTTAFVVELLVGGNPSCGCLGLILAHKALLSSAWVVLPRNLILIACAIYAVDWRRTSVTVSPSPLTAAPIPSRAGMPLIETLLVIALIGLLMALLLPSLSGAKRSALQTKSASNARSHATVFAAYAADYKDMSPYITDPNARRTVIRCVSGNVAGLVRYFQACTAWKAALGDAYYGGCSSLSFLDPVPESTYKSYFYPCVFITHPDYWDARTRLAGNSQWTPTRVGDVTYPSHKAWVSSDFYPPPDSGPGETRVVLAFVDGHSGVFNDAKVNPRSLGAEGRDAYFEYTIHYDLQGILHTDDGVRGRDINP